MLRELRRGDIERVSEIHFMEFRNSFFCLLGRDFLFELYDGILKSEHAFSYVFEEDSEVVGFVAGALHPGRFFVRLLTSKFPRFSVIILKRALKNPGILVYGLQTLSYPLKNSIPADAEVLAISVDEKHRKKGIGSMLLKHVLHALAEKKARRIKVVVDEDNAAGNSFYKANGFTLADTIKLYGKKMNAYVYLT